MPKSSPVRFDCPNCGAKYKLVKVEADPTRDREIACRSCGGPLDGWEGVFALKYFMVERPRPQAEMRRAG
jgi:DNA-directed RNA polymerase subunit RPC12/RpoP